MTGCELGREGKSQKGRVGGGGGGPRGAPRPVDYIIRL